MKGAAIVLALWIVGPPPAGAAAPGGVLHKIPLTELRIRSLTAGTDAPAERLSLRDDRPSRIEFATDWDDVGTVRIELTGRSEPLGDRGVRSVSLGAILTLPGGHRVQTSRTSTVDEHGTILFELFRQGERPLTLAIDATISETWEVVSRPKIGAPVRFEIEVLRVEGGTGTSLERNQLNTFVDQTVRYEFRHGPDQDDEALTLTLTPIRVLDDLVQIRISLEGRLDNGAGMTVIARDETVAVSRGGSSPVTAVVGDPPTGYEFRVTTRF